MSNKWSRTVREYGPSVYRTAWRILGNADDADEVVQDVFLQAHQYEASNCVSNRAGLLKRLAVCRSLDQLRRRRTKVSLDDVVVIDSGSDPEAQAIGNELESCLRDAVRQLPEREAEVFCLRYFDQLTNQQIADMLNLKSAAVATATYRARTKLAGMLTDLIRGTH